MIRLLGALAALLLVGSVFFLPEARRDRFAEIETGQLLIGDVPEELRLPEEREEDPDGTESYARLLVRELGEIEESEGNPDSWNLSLGQVTVLDTLEASPEKIRESLVRSLRMAAAKGKNPLQLNGDTEAAEEGVDFNVSIQPNQTGMEELKLIPNGASPELTNLLTVEFNPPKPTSLLPPLVAIALALLFRKPILALLAGVIAAGSLMRSGDGLLATINPFAAVADVALAFWGQFMDSDKAQVVGFVIAMLAMVGVITHNGGLRGVMDIVAARAKDARRTQIATWFMGLIVFFDDYANTILCGATMRPLTDRFRVCREKLAYLVDSTAAPVAGISIFSTWVAFEVTQFAPQLPAAGRLTSEGYAVFVETIPYRFYCLFALALCGMVAFTGRDFGPMLTAERRARRTGEVVRKGGAPMVSDLVTKMAPAEGVVGRAWRALVPLAVFISFTIGWVLYTGFMGATDVEWGEGLAKGLGEVLGESDSYGSLLYGSSAGLLVAVVISLISGMRGGIGRAAFSGLSATGVALAILYLAWMIGAACGDLGTAKYITAAVGDALPPALLPVLLFFLSGAIAFSTGSSWSTMTILLPLVVGLAYQLGMQNELDALDGAGMVVVSIGAVLEGAIFGDHCSPISDTTVLSSTACASDHVDHVRTQMPYALLAMTVAVVCGYLPVTYLDASPWVCLPVGVLAMFATLRLIGGRADEGPDAVAVEA